MRALLLLGAALATACSGTIGDTPAIPPPPPGSTAPDAAPIITPPAGNDDAGVPPAPGADASVPPPVSCDQACRDMANPSSCTTNAQYFQDYAWPQVFVICSTCHVAGGAAAGTRFMLQPATVAGFMDQNFRAVGQVRRLEQDGTPLIVLKPTLTIPHQGGQQITPGSRPHAILLAMIDRIDAPVTCPGVEPPPPTPVTQGVTLMSPYQTLRKASLELAGRPPTAAEIMRADTDGEAALPALIQGFMAEPAFYERLREIFADVFLTDGFLYANRGDTNQNRLISTTNFPPRYLQMDGMEDWEWAHTRRGVRTGDALAREPVEMVVHAVQNDRPISEILTARYRLLNAYSAKLLGVPFRGVPAAMIDTTNADPLDFEEVNSVPTINESGSDSEYAGILSTTAFLGRYPNTPTNFNRKRARMIYKYFLDFDIMKLASRIDAAAVDLSANPTRNNMQCTGCHSQIDPLAGAMMNWTQCGYEDGPRYFGPLQKDRVCDHNGWVSPMIMFPPGTGPGVAAVIPEASWRQSGQVLAASIAARPEFARAMVTHLVIGLLNRPLLATPGDTNAPGYASIIVAVAAEQDELTRLTTAFVAGGLRVKPLIEAIVLSPAFRAANADLEGRVELIGLGGGSMTIPESLDRRITATLGFVFQEPAVSPGHDQAGQRYLLRRTELKTLYGGADGTFDGVKARQRTPSSLSARISQRMALMMSCIATPRDLDKPAAQRKLFPYVTATLVPNGNAADATQAPILQNIQFLHERFLGERLAVDDPEILATYRLLSESQAEGAGLVRARTVDDALSRPCANDVDVTTGAFGNFGTVNDPAFVVRAWQTVIAYLLMDYDFLFDP